jgi:hypothetical protein
LKYKILFVVVWREKGIANREGGNEREREREKRKSGRKKKKKKRGDNKYLFMRDTRRS